MNEGVCRGGPLSGFTRGSRFPRGFLLVDKAVGLCWIYEWDGVEFRVRDEMPSSASKDARMRIATEHKYDVIAAPWGGSHGN